MKKSNKLFKQYGMAFTLALSAIAAFTVFAINHFFLKSVLSSVAATFIDIFAMGVLLLPAGIRQYASYRRVHEVEEKFPEFLRSVVEGLRGGMTLPLSINYASRNYYGALDLHIGMLSAQISWGVPFDQAMKTFSESLGSKTIARSVSTINEAHRSGGNIIDVLDSVTKSTVEIDKIRRERESRISSQMMTGYIIFFVFIGVMIGMREFLLPALSWGGVSQGGEEWMAASNQSAVDPEVYGNMFMHLAIIQGIFSGLAIGRLAYGSVGAGVRHSIIMAALGYGGLVLAHAVFS